jgi:hypothetical protein
MTDNDSVIDFGRLGESGNVDEYGNVYSEYEQELGPNRRL